MDMIAVTRSHLVRKYSLAVPDNVEDYPETDPQTVLTAEELRAHWMPFTGNRQFKRAPRLFASAEGVYYTTVDGRKVFDGLSGLWTCGLGHCRPEIAEAVSQQISKLDYSPGFQYGHPLHRFTADLQRTRHRHGQTD